MTCRRCIEALLLCLALARPAAAEDAFKAHYEAGLNLYSSEEYEAAVKEFQAAYSIKPKPRLLFNIGQSYRSLGNAHEALRFYLLYQAMESKPKPGLKAELEGYIVQMKSIVEQAERAHSVEVEATQRPVIVVEPAPGGAQPGTSQPGTSRSSSSQPGTSQPGTSRSSSSQPGTSQPLINAQSGAPPPPKSRAWIWGVAGGVALSVVVVGLSVGLTRDNPYHGDIRHPTF